MGDMGGWGRWALPTAHSNACVALIAVPVLMCVCMCILRRRAVQISRRLQGRNRIVPKRGTSWTTCKGAWYADPAGQAEGGGTRHVGFSFPGGGGGGSIEPPKTGGGGSGKGLN